MWEDPHISAVHDAHLQPLHYAQGGLTRAPHLSMPETNVMSPSNQRPDFSTSNLTARIKDRDTL